MIGERFQKEWIKWSWKHRPKKGQQLTQEENQSKKDYYGYSIHQSELLILGNYKMLKGYRILIKYTK